MRIRIRAKNDVRIDYSDGLTIVASRIHPQQIWLYFYDPHDFDHIRDRTITQTDEIVLAFPNITPELAVLLRMKYYPEVTMGI